MGAGGGQFVDLLELARNGADEVVDGLKVEVSFGRAVIAGFMKGFV